MRVGLWNISIAALILLAGCGGQRAEFTSREELDELIPEAQAHVQTVLNGDEEFVGYFGSPTNSVAWERLAVQFHGATGVYGEPPEEGASDAATFPISLVESNRPIEAGQEFVWLSGDNVRSEPYRVESINEDEGTITIDRPLDAQPETGDRFAIAPGVVLQHGRTLYAEHCQHCHGVTGDGNGPTAKYLNPPPRDYRLGKFKFTSTNSSAKANREDLARVIENGIPGTYMPSFKLLEADELQAIVEYIRWLAMRGENEYRIVRTLANDYSHEAVDSAVASARESDSELSSREAREQVVAEMMEYLDGDWEEEFNDDTKFQAEQWRASEDVAALVLPTVARVPNTPESRARGRELYLGQKAKCATCHGDAGLGDGPQTLAVQKNPITNADFDEPGLFDDWGNPLKPRNLTRGMYRGGRRPLDLYRRLHAGIKGTPMPAFGTVLQDEQIWDIVNYITHIPFEAREQRPGAGAGESRPEPEEVAATAPNEEVQIAN